ncbi:uncharacterized protein TRIVIDRAFT_221683 [Trichoderma virens Gv29-8]|uniref:Uncharacterized protein n=1 Tax=Hypocrea virens (strain Gv29-8 / FGSC 10586) TaxID=413071 RepID=G9MTQ4_HYPVG|nr:uncharacterized protein TRIVIDRAFT_221683 [Trichoderma virens Gv29-8]EHK22404.1 hypothetical protein TRIVIDRAFT_221683 [Trichoderma virens Gv29-8]UKZ47445.1 hypothetical protein TrVGV298_001663 [Trichoderma virens]
MPATLSHIKANLAKWNGLGHRVGIQVLHKWDTVPKGQTVLARHSGMSEKTLKELVEPVVCDVVPKELLCLTSAFNNGTTRELISDEVELLDKISPRPMEAISFSSSFSANLLSVENKTQNLISPDEMVAGYLEEKKTKSLINKMTNARFCRFLLAAGTIG